MRSEFEYIETQIDACWPQVIISEQEAAIDLQGEALAALPLNLQRHLLRRVTAHLCGGQSPLEPRHYALIERLLQGPADRQARSLDLPQGLRVTRILHKVTFARPYDIGFNQFVGNGDERDKSRPHSGEEVTLSIPGEVAVPGTPWIARAEMLTGTLLEKAIEALRREDWPEVWHLLPVSRYVVYIDASSVGTSLQARTRRPGDRLRPLGMLHEKKVQDMLVDKRIARPARDSIPLFFSASHCIWLAGVALDERARLTGNTEHIVRLCIVPA